jgi:hypothetical protein
MLSFLWHSVWAWIGLGGITIVILGVVAWFIPGFRLIAIEIAGAILAATAIYTKGSRDEALANKKREEEAVKKAKADYDKIDARPDTPSDVDKRLRDGSF